MGMPSDDTVQVEVRTQDEVTRPDLRSIDVAVDAPPVGPADATDATGFRELAAFLEAEARAAASPARRADCEWALGRVQLERLGDGRAAVAGFRTALARDPRLVPG